MEKIKVDSIEARDMAIERMIAALDSNVVDLVFIWRSYGKEGGLLDQNFLIDSRENNFVKGFISALMQPLKDDSYDDSETVTVKIDRNRKVFCCHRYSDGDYSLVDFRIHKKK